MRLRKMLALGLCFVAVVVTAHVSAAQDFRGRINGTVSDNTGAVLPGVTVTATSAALIQPQVQVSGADGEYRFLALPPGADHQYFPARQVRTVLPVHVHWFGDTDPTEDEARLRAFLRACADIERGACETEAKLTRGGLAVDTRITNKTLETASMDGAQIWVTVELAITFHRTFGAPSGETIQ